MPTNVAAVTAHDCPGICIHAIDIVQPPGIGIAPIVDMDALHTMVTAVLTAMSSADTPKNAREEAVVSMTSTQPLYSSWRRHQAPFSLRPLGARSSHWYVLHTPSSPRAYAE